ncbi:hypothetical protein ACIBG8_13775 [Nonomuraea sp. NPDC050556]|uniref:hypothetical protein n=1 Tax=Nonomuraea sp. NPDC050556 TaxID=3364369 RepID=UPI0037B17D01
MAAIVGVHGIGKYKYYVQAGGSPSGAAELMRAKWDRYLHAALGGDTSAYFTEIAYFAHYLNDGKGKVEAQPTVEEMAAPAQKVLVEWAKELGLGERFTGGLRVVVGWLMRHLDSRAAAFAALFCPEVAAYITDQAKREKCRQAVADVIRKNRPKVVVAHSLGSVVTYETLWANPDLEVDLLITLGSPLGMHNVVFEHLLPAPINGRGQRPKGVKRWVNIADKDDIAALPPDLAARFTGIDVETQVNLDWIDFHTVEKYLGCGALNEHLRPYLA